MTVTLFSDHLRTMEAAKNDVDRSRFLQALMDEYMRRGMRNGADLALRFVADAIHKRWCGDPALNQQRRARDRKLPIAHAHWSEQIVRSIKVEEIIP